MSTWKKAQGIEIVGLEEAIKTLEETLPREAHNLSAQAVQAVATKVRNEIRRETPKGKTGELRKSVAAKRNRARNNKASSDVYFKADGWYWKFLEYGTVKMKARPWVNPIVERMAPKIPDMFREELGKKLERLMAKKAKKAAKK